MSGERTVIWLHNDDHSLEVLSSVGAGHCGLLTPRILDLLSGKSVPSGMGGWDGPRGPLLASFLCVFKQLGSKAAWV